MDSDGEQLSRKEEPDFNRIVLEHFGDFIDEPKQSGHQDNNNAIQIDGSKVLYAPTTEGDVSLQISNNPDFQNTVEYVRAYEKPVKERNLKVYEILAILAIVIYFPVGIPAYYNALKLKKEYYEGISKGDMHQCIKRAARVEKLLIISFSLCLFTVLLTLAMVSGVSKKPY